MKPTWSLHFLGTGAAHAAELGSSSAVLLCGDEPLLMIDCGPDSLARYEQAYGAPPPAVYITHLHMDHVGGLEGLFHRLWFDPRHAGRTHLYTHAALLPLLQSRVADYPGVLAEGGVNFWEAFRLVPCSRGFWHAGLWFEVFPTRHHRAGSSYGLALPGSFVWTGDTRPIPEVLETVAVHDEPIAHDCGLVGNPSHTGVDDLQREYTQALRKRFVLYHYGSRADGEAMRAQGLVVAEPGQRLALPVPCEVSNLVG